jgi:signal transduction histidine kinase
VIEVSADGRGGADPTSGGGLQGLADRVRTLDDRFSVHTDAGRGTTIRAEIPCASS